MGCGPLQEGLKVPLSKPLKDHQIWFHTLGCRTNLYESEALASSLVCMGASLVEDPAIADIAVIQTCTVTSMADRKTRQIIRKVKRENPGAILVASGCWSQKISREEAFSLGVDLVVGSRRKSDIPGMILSYLQKRQPCVLRYEGSPPGGIWDPLFLGETHFHTRAFIKVQDGCDHFCTYCIIPYVRGLPVSRDPEDVLSEITRLAVEGGIREVILTGIHLGLYGKEDGSALGELVRRISLIAGIERIRFGSFEPFSLDRELLTRLAEVPQFCPHLHLPLQSGDDHVLSRMRRGYTVSEYMKVLDMARSILGSEIHVSTDIMTGFPGESEEAFRHTMDVMEKAAFGKVHVFPYSPRRGTPAAGWKDQVSPVVRRERAQEALTLSLRLYRDYCRRWIGSVLPVLIEGPESPAHGLTPQFLKVVLSGALSPGEIEEVRISSLDGDYLKGVTVTGSMQCSSSAE